MKRRVGGNHAALQARSACHFPDGASRNRSKDALVQTKLLLDVAPAAVMHDAGLGTCRAFVQAEKVDQIERSVVDVEAMQSSGRDACKRHIATLSRQRGSGMQQMFRGRGVCCVIDGGRRVEAPAQAYKRSITNGGGEGPIGFATVQSLGPAEDTAVCFDDLSEILGHGATIKSQPEPAEPPSTRSVENFWELYLGTSRCTWRACHVQRQHPTQRGIPTRAI